MDRLADSLVRRRLRLNQIVREGLYVVIPHRTSQRKGWGLALQPEVEELHELLDDHM